MISGRRPVKLCTKLLKSVLMAIPKPRLAYNFHIASDSCELLCQQLTIVKRRSFLLFFMTSRHNGTHSLWPVPFLVSCSIFFYD